MKPIPDEEPAEFDALSQGVMSQGD